MQKEGLEKYLDKDRKIISWPETKAGKQIVCEYLASFFKEGKIYTEREVTQTISDYHLFMNPTMLRRELIARKLMTRKSDGSAYWKVESDLSIFATKLINYIEQEKLAVYGLEVWNDSQLIKSWGNTNTRFPIYSITKSIVSLAFGIAESEGIISISDKVSKYIPEEKNLPQELTLERLLTMSIKNLPFRPAGDNWLEFIAAQKFELEPREFCYSNLNAYLIAVALENALNRPLYDYINERIFTPLGIENPKFCLSPEGRFNGASGIELSVNELSKIGQLLMNKGKYNGQQIVSEEYINCATGIQQMNKEGGYGYFFWKFLDGFSLNGKWGQKIYCFPERKFMISFLSNLEQGSGELKKIIYELCKE